MQRLWDHLEDKPGATVTVDLESRTVKAGEGPDAIEDSFDIDDYTRWRLLEGLDDVDITLSHDDDISSYEVDPADVETGDNSLISRGFARSSATENDDDTRARPLW